MFEAKVHLEKGTIHYIQNGKSLKRNVKNILFVHGNSASAKSFEKLIKSNKLMDYNAIAIDLPGHGFSYRVKNDALDSNVYTIKYYTSVICELVRELQLDNPVLVGHSLGAHITTAVAQQLDFCGLLSIQNTPVDLVAELAEALILSAETNIIYKGELTREELLPLSNKYFPLGNMPPYFITDFLECDPNCRTNLSKSLPPELRVNEVEFIKSLGNRYLLYLGTNDGLTNIKYIKNLPFLDRIIIKNNFGHFPHLDSPDIFIESLLKFVSGIS